MSLCGFLNLSRFEPIGSPERQRICPRTSMIRAGKNYRTLSLKAFSNEINIRESRKPLRNGMAPFQRQECHAYTVSVAAFWNGLTLQLLKGRIIMKRVLMIVTAAVLFSSVAMSSQPTGASAQSVMCQGHVATIVGGSGNDILTGTPNDDAHSWSARERYHRRQRRQ